ncbi:MAG: DNA polymerase III subunit gamma/tau, partial [Desulfonatronovibrionaceae bacterium]
MTRDNLTARYRPQTFAQVAGQGFIKKILSRACARDKIAPAYIFSGTRGVGKTSLARVMAKGINCLQGPDEEPCNQCRNCRQITAGTCTDVMEIDAASYTGVDNVRRLREEVFYSPLGCRFKVVIIDEVHMLSRSAFNALLKTIEEPPKHCVFIMATTEPKKIPATIISRCQHFVFKNLPRAELEGHLKHVLEAEGQDFEPKAVEILAKRADGSVRDSMSLVSQVLALGGEKLTEADVRSVLGLAGQEFFLNLVCAVRDQDLPALEGLIDDLLDQGLDLGFFLREFAQCWRNMFLIRQAGDQAAQLLDMDQELAGQWRELAAGLPVQFIHAAWQMVLESQYGILKSLEPGQALELLLLNLAYLPHLLPVSELNTGAEDRKIPIPD